MLKDRRVTAPPAPPLDRARELREISDALDGLQDGGGNLLVVEGAPGIGKTTLLDAAARLAAERGHEVYEAEGIELERAFAWGVARQLFERRVAELDGDERERVLGGVAAAAQDVLTTFEPEHAADSFAAVHALYWLTANLAAERPLVLAVDDAQWADAATLRYLAYLAPRIGFIPVLLIVGARAVDGAPAELRALAHDPFARRLLPEPLSGAAVGDLLERTLGAPSDAAFTEACREATGGNPLLVTTLTEALGEDGIEPTAEAAPRARELGARALSDTVVHRMLRLPAAARELARAVAALGGDAEPHLAARLAGLEPEAARAAADALIAEHVLDGGRRRLAFQHPLLQSAVDEVTPPGVRQELHARAAEVLRENGAAPERIAGHWLMTASGAGPAAVDDLRAAARTADAHGAPDAAVRYLRRALEEPLPEAEKADLLGELGAAELHLGLEVGERRVRQALAATTNGRRYAELALELRSRLFATERHAEGAELFMAALERLGPEERELQLTLRADVAAATRIAFGRPGDVAGAGELEGATAGERRLLAVAAFERTMAGGTAEEVVALGARAREDTTLGGYLGLLVAALLAADRVDDAAHVSRSALDRARRRGRRTFTFLFSFMEGMIAHRRGRLAEAAADAERGLAGVEELGHATLIAHSGATLLGIEVDRGRYDEAKAALSRLGADGDLPVTFAANRVRYERARFRLATGDTAGGRADLEALLAHDLGWQAANPAWTPVRSTLALAIGDAGLAREELELATRWGAPTAIGVAQRAVGLVTGDEEMLRRSCERLEDSPARLELARSLVEHGAAIRRAGRRTEARAPLRRGLELADRCGAAALAERAREELRAAGARPRRAAVGGVEALTPSELRVARLAADGLTNREIAQALFVTLRTVEVHLTHTYQKLSIGSRAELAAAMRSALSERAR